MADSSVTILIGGEAGQGIATIGPLMTRALVRTGYEVHVTQDYMSRVRGGHNTFAIRFSPDPVAAPADEVDILVALNQEAIDLHTPSLSNHGVVITDVGLETGDAKAFKVPFDKLAPKPIYDNTVALGVLASAICEDIGVVEVLLAQAFGKKGEAIVQANHDVLRAAYKWQKEHPALLECPPPASDDPEKRKRLTMNGNEALALGAMAAGVNFLSFYPMTPSTTVGLNIIAHSERMGIVVEQAEDEIAAINMALGASYAGARAMTTTSGGGFALMTEGISLAGITETPIVVTLVQRPGPATGLPTRTEQADLNLVLYAGHGEFPRAVYAPGTVEQCFHLQHAAFDMAEKWQSPVFVLSDQYLADSYRAVEPFELDDLPEAAAPVLEPENPDEYKRYAFDFETGLSPRAVPGMSRALVCVDSDEHDEEGRIVEAADARIKMMHKRALKECGMHNEIIPPDYDGPDTPEVLLVCWGSTLGAADEAAELMRDRGEEIGVLHFSQVWPLNPSHFLPLFETASTVACVEGNATGQFAQLLRKVTGFRLEHLILRFDGRPFTPGSILSGLEGVSS